MLWARERIRDLEEGGDAKQGSKQVRKQKESRDKVIIELSTRFNLISQLTSFVTVEKREEKNQATGEMVLREVPALVTVGWHGLGNILGQRAPAAFPGSQPAYQCLSVPERSYERQFAKEPAIQFSLFNASKPAFRIRSEKVGAKDDQSGPIDDLLHILSLQKAHGGMEIDDKTASILGLDLGMMYQMAEEIEAIVDSEKHILIATAVVLVALERLFAAQRQIWEPIIQKSKEWLEEMIRKANPQIKGRKLMDWVEEWVNT